MKEFIISENDAGARLDKFVSKAVPALPGTLAQKYIRLKRIKVNGKRASRDTRLALADVVSMYVNDEFFTEAKTDAFNITPQLDIVFEDDNILLLDKRPGMSVHEDEHSQGNTLIDHIKAYLFQNSKWDPNVENSFVPALCNRIDRNTGGLVIAAKNAPALRILNEKLREREIDKRYLCIVSGKLSPPIGELSSYLKKDNAENRVYAKSADTAGAKRAVTRYRTLKTSGELSLLECELITGRTHQIRAQLAACGHPLLGDEKYGDHALNKRYGLMSQALYSYKLTFAFKSPAAPLDYLNGRTFTVPHVPFANTYFGD